MLCRDELCGSGSEALKKIRKALHKGNVTRIVVTDSEEKTLVNIPVNFLAAGFLMAPFLVSCAAVLSLVRNCRLRIESRE